MTSVPFLFPQEPLPHGMQACTTLRAGGVSQAPFDSLNLGLHVGDDPTTVQRNRQIIYQALQLPSEPLWLRQTHSVRVFTEGSSVQDEYDAAYTANSARVLAILTADCLPVVLMSPIGQQIAVAHAGWRGLANGILQNTVAHFSGQKTSIVAWLGPAIGPQRFEVGDEVRASFCDQFKDVAATQAAFVTADSVGMSPGKWCADLYQLARLALLEVGVTSVIGGGLCTYAEPAKYYSYRRDGQRSGRMATLVWRS